jgi:hypothetical protein
MASGRKSLCTRLFAKAFLWTYSKLRSAQPQRPQQRRSLVSNQKDDGISARPLRGVRHPNRWSDRGE